MSYVRSLIDYLMEKNSGLSNRLQEIQNIAEAILQYSQAKFPYYTPHGFLHSKNVLENLNWLLPEDVKEELNGHELFFLIVAAWLHDWGMVGKPEEKPDQIREYHHIRTEEKFEKEFSLVRVGENEGRMIGRICRGHRQEDLHNNLYDDIPFEKGILVHIRFLTAALRIADELDVTHSRVPEIIYYELNPTDKAEEEFKKQMHIIGIGYPSENEKYKLCLSAVAWDPIGVVAVNQLKEKIQMELNQVKTILSQGINHKGMTLDYVESSIVTKGFMKDPIEFQLDREKILELLIGHGLYLRKDAAIRELIQNAIDACRVRLVEQGSFSAEITISQNENSITIEDNGVGMDFPTAKKYLAVVGSSFYSSEEFKKLTEEKKVFDPISRWGLGFLSCFLMASKITIETKKTDCPACRFIISGVDKGWRYENSPKKKIGTSVCLELKQEMKSLNINDVVPYYVKGSEFPIFLKKGEILTQYHPSWNIKSELKDGFEKLKIAGIVEKEDRPPSIKFQYYFENEEFQAWFYGIEHAYTASYIFSDDTLISLQGIRTKVPDSFSSDHNLLTVLNTKKNIVDFEVSREHVINNEKFAKLLRNVAVEYIKLLQKEFAKGSKETSFEEVVKWYLFLNSRLGRNTYRFMTRQDIKNIILDSLNPIITEKADSFEKIGDLVKKKPKKVLIFKCSNYILSQKVENERRRTTSLVKRSLKKDEVALLYYGPLLSPVYRLTDIETELLDEILEENNIAHILGNFEKCANSSSKIVGTPIDGLLPSFCRFAETPNEYDGVVIIRKLFELKDSENKRKDRDNIIQIAPILAFKDFPSIYEEIKKIVTKRLTTHGGVSVNVDDKFSAEGLYLISIRNPIVEFLLKNAPVILKNSMFLEISKVLIRGLIIEHTPMRYDLDQWAKGLVTTNFFLLKEFLNKD